MGELVLPGPFDNVGQLLAAAAQTHPEVEAFVDGDVRITYAQWLRQASGLAAVLTERGVRRGDVVCLLLPSSLDFAVAHAAVLLLGGVVTAVNTRLGPTEVDGIVARCAPAAIIGSGSDRPVAPPGYAGVLIGRDELPAAFAHDPLASLPAVTLDDPAVVVWTSGTTGAPKGATYDHRALAGAAAVAGVLCAPFDRRIMPIPMAHAGFLARIWDQIAHVITVVLSPVPWTAESMLDVLERERITVGQGVPTQWAKLLDLPQLDPQRLSRLRLVATGATRVPAELVRALRARLGVPVTVRYAASEAPSITGTRLDDPPEVLEHTVGRPQEGIDVRLLDEDGQQVAPGEVGRVTVRSPFAMRGYWNDPEQTAMTLVDGWVRSTDLGRLDDAGNLTLMGRAGDVYIRGGFNVHPLEVENTLTAHPAVVAAAVVGTAAPVIGEIGVAFVVADRALTVDEVREWCRARIADYKTPDVVQFVDELPLTSMMKVDKTELARRAARTGPARGRR